MTSERSKAAGWAWLVCLDEYGYGPNGVKPDSTHYRHDGVFEVRRFDPRAERPCRDPVKKVREVGQGFGVGNVVPLDQVAEAGV